MPPVDNSEDTITSESQEEELQSIQVETKIDSNTEYLEKQNVRLEQIVIIEKKNHVKLKEYENLKSDIDNMLEWFWFQIFRFYYLKNTIDGQKSGIRSNTLLFQTKTNLLNRINL